MSLNVPITSTEFEKFPPELQARIFELSWTLSNTSPAFRRALDAPTDEEVLFTPELLPPASHQAIRKLILDTQRSAELAALAAAGGASGKRSRRPSFSLVPMGSPLLLPSGPPSPSGDGDHGHGSITPLLSASKPAGYTNTNPFVLPECPLSPSLRITAPSEHVPSLPSGAGAGAGSGTGASGYGAAPPRLPPGKPTRPGAAAAVASATAASSKRRRIGRAGAAVAKPKPKKATARASASGRTPGAPVRGRKDASKAEQFLTHMRTQFNPVGKDFRKFVQDVNTGLTDNNEIGAAMKRFDTRPKYALRKLAFSILPETSVKREAFARDVLHLGGKVSTQQREAVKSDLVTILMAICDHCPDLARIPTTWNQKA